MRYVRWLARIGGEAKGTAKLTLIVPQQLSNGFVQLRQGTAEIKLR
jgi:hypothetical protein